MERQRHIQLNLRDITYSRVDRRELQQATIAGYSQRLWDTRNVTLGISYQLRKGMKLQQVGKDNKEEHSRLQ